MAPTPAASGGNEMTYLCDECAVDLMRTHMLTPHFKHFGRMPMYANAQCDLCEAKNVPCVYRTDVSDVAKGLIAIKPRPKD